MPSRNLHRLSAAEVRTKKKIGRHADGGNLYLSISENGGRRWVFMYQRDGRQRELGLGPAEGAKKPGVSLQAARARAAEARTLLQTGHDPIHAKRVERGALTFGEFSDQLLDDTIGPGLKNEKHLDQWKMTLREYAAPLRPLPVAKITTDDVLGVLKPIWQTKNETASRLRGRIERILDAAKAKGLRTGDNPARWRGHLKELLPKRQRLARGHHAAIKYEDMPAFMAKLRTKKSISGRALEFTILTAARTGETIGATWGEIDLDAKLWTVPAGRMKAKREHEVPLSDRALEILRSARPQGEVTPDAPVFPTGDKVTKPLSNMAMLKLLTDMQGKGVTVHGFRSSFRDWAGDETNFPRDVVEAALAHVIENKTEAAYRRSTALAKRRELMDAWATFLGPR